MGDGMRRGARAGVGVAVAALLGWPAGPEAWAEARVVPSAVEFGGQAVGGQSEPRVVELVNIGQHPMYVHHGMVNSGPDNADFVAVKDECTGATVPPGGQCAVELAFKPSGEGSTSQTYGFDVSGGDYRLLAERAAVVTLIGTGLPGARGGRASGPAQAPTPVPIGLYLPVAGIGTLGLGLLLVTAGRRQQPAR